MVDYLKLLAIALVLTVVVEAGIAWFFRLRSKTDLAALILINIITNPALNYLILIIKQFQLPFNNLTIILLLEIGVVLVEWRLLIWVLRQEKKKMLMLSIVMNISSYLAGLAVFRWVIS